LLVTEGFTSVEEVAFVPVEDLHDIEGFDEEVAEELRARARGFLESRDADLAKQAADLGMKDDINEVAGVTPAMMVALGKNEVKSRDDLADLAGDELIEILDKEDMKGVLTEDQANEIIMLARAHWFADDEAPASEEESTEVAEEAAEDTAENGDG